jgi:hypothetical protein
LDSPKPSTQFHRIEELEDLILLTSLNAKGSAGQIVIDEAPDRGAAVARSASSNPPGRRLEFGGQSAKVVFAVGTNPFTRGESEAFKPTLALIQPCSGANVLTILLFGRLANREADGREIAISRA